MDLLKKIKFSTTNKRKYLPDHPTRHTEDTLYHPAAPGTLNSFLKMRKRNLARLLSRHLKVLPWLVWLSGLRGLRTIGSPVQFPVRAHAWVADQVPSMGHSRGNHAWMFLFLSFSFPSPLKINE